ncbi:unnamed protein product [Prunus brigantina]
MPWLKRPSPLKENLAKKDTSRYCEFYEGHSHYTNDCFAWKNHLEKLVEDGNCTEFIARGAIQQINDRDTVANEPPRKNLTLLNQHHLLSGLSCLLLCICSSLISCTTFGVVFLHCSFIYHSLQQQATLPPSQL